MQQNGISPKEVKHFASDHMVPSYFLLLMCLPPLPPLSGANVEVVGR